MDPWINKPDEAAFEGLGRACFGVPNLILANTNRHVQICYMIHDQEQFNIIHHSWILVYHLSLSFTIEHIKPNRKVIIC